MSVNVTENPPTSYKIYPLLKTCDDVRYNGMRQIAYDYDSAGTPASAAHGAIQRENNKATGDYVSKISPAVKLPKYDPYTNEYAAPTLFTETRGDGPTPPRRSIHRDSRPSNWPPPK